ncbi:Adenine phosphoribosyltransferase [Dirofilaria immitis]
MAMMLGDSNSDAFGDNDDNNEWRQSFHIAMSIVTFYNGDDNYNHQDNKTCMGRFMAHKTVVATTATALRQINLNKFISFLLFLFEIKEFKIKFKIKPFPAKLFWLINAACMIFYPHSIVTLFKDHFANVVYLLISNCEASNKLRKSK